MAAPIRPPPSIRAMDATRGADEPVVHDSLDARDEFYFNVR
jgi:hypothetical protein